MERMTPDDIFAEMPPKADEFCEEIAKLLPPDTPFCICLGDTRVMKVKPICHNIQGPGEALNFMRAALNSIQADLTESN